MHIKYFNLKEVKHANLKQFPKKTIKEFKLADKKPYHDSDKDKAINYYDCKPLSKKQKDYLSYERKLSNPKQATNGDSVKQAKFSGWGQF